MKNWKSRYAHAAVARMERCDVEISAARSAGRDARFWIWVGISLFVCADIQIHRFLVAICDAGIRVWRGK